MICPKCNVELKMAERQGVEIDYCPQCRGVWLDRGELDKIIERSSNLRDEPEDFDYGSGDDRKRYDDRDDNRRSEYGNEGQKRKRSFWRDIFDFD